MKKKLMSLFCILLFGVMHASEAKKESSYFDYVTSAAAWVVPSSVAEAHKQIKHLAEVTYASSKSLLGTTQLPSTICSLCFIAGIGALDVHSLFYSQDPGLLDAWNDPSACINYYTINFDRLALKIGVPAATMVFSYFLKKIRNKEKSILKGKDVLQLGVL